MRRIVFCIFFFTVIPVLLFSQDIDLASAPSWLLMELGEKAYGEKEFGEALTLFREVKRREGVYPEADYWIGLVFEADAELGLAIEQLKAAYRDRNQLYTLDDKYTILYKLADLYVRNGDYLSYEETLKLIIADDEEFNAVRMEVLVRVLQEKGLDSLLKLYRFGSDYSINAHLHLGAFLHESGRNPQSINHLLFAVITIFSRSIEFLRNEDPDYTFEDTGSFFDFANEFEELGSYFTSTGHFQGIYLLAKAFDETGHSVLARSLWKVVAEESGDTLLQNRARKDLM